MSHYICTGGCQGVSEAQGTCQAEDCNNWGEPLEPCECEDGSHEKGEGETKVESEE